MKTKRGIPYRHLGNLFKSLPNISQKQLDLIRQSADSKTYQILKRFSGLIDSSIISNLEHDVQTFMSMAQEIDLQENNLQEN